MLDRCDRAEVMKELTQAYQAGDLARLRATASSGKTRIARATSTTSIPRSGITATRVGGSLGISGEVAAFGYKVAGSVVASGSLARSSGKTLSASKSLELSVELSGVERNGITNLRDAPLVPGEKVDRYRFMTFYLEGSTDHFDDFFRVVVDPVWLASNTEGARALRKTRAAKPNKCWRVLHRVTYVERPTLWRAPSQTPYLRAAPAR